MGTISIICVLSIIVVSISTLPLKTKEVEVPKIVTIEAPSDKTEVVSTVDEFTIDGVNPRNFNGTQRNMVRPGQQVTNYAVEITPDVGAGTFSGRLVAQVVITDLSTRADEIVFHVADLDVSSVEFSFAGGSVFTQADFFINDDENLAIVTGFEATLYTFIIEYEGQLGTTAAGLFVGTYGINSYMAMNLAPTHARRVFPCMDEPTEASTVSFTFNDVPHTHIVLNSMPEDNSVSQFRALQGPPHLWGMVAHDFVNIIIPTANVMLFGRPGLNQDAQASVAMQFYYNNLNEWTNKPYFEIVVNQDGRMVIFALPDTSVDWYALSTVCIWEPHILMETQHSIQQRKTALIKIAEGMARQWFGYVIHPENWSSQWVIAGLGSYAAWTMLRMFQEDPNDINMLDVNTLFVTDVIQESLLWDGFSSVTPLDPGDDLFDEDAIRAHNNGLLKSKAPAILWMLRVMLGDDQNDFIQTAARALLNSRSLQTVNTLNFIDAIKSEWLSNGNGIVDELQDFLEPWLENRGYPVVHVGLRQGGLLVTQEHFGFTATSTVNYEIPLTYTGSVNPNFDDIHPMLILENTETIPQMLDEEDFVLFNLQGQGYYRVNYDNELWERIIMALEDPDERERIHPLNRATLVDDALNLARAGKLDYEFAFRVVLTMEHETEYAVWKAFVRNMDFLRKRLVALVTEDEELDPDIYLRMVRRTVGAVENELGFSPEVNLIEPAMASLTRGLVMDHACRAGYQPCIAAAVDWFYDPDSNDRVVNPNIPRDLRPAVYCAMVREGDAEAREALVERLELEPSLHERVVILESLACAQDPNYINSLLLDTISNNGPYSVEERSRIFAAVAASSFENAGIALNFIAMRTNEIRDMYGGPVKLEELIFSLADDMANVGLTVDFTVWVNSQQSNLGDSEAAAWTARDMLAENRVWMEQHMDYVYEWIDENDAPRLAASLALLAFTALLALCNH